MSTFTCVHQMIVPAGNTHLLAQNLKDFEAYIDMLYSCNVLRGSLGVRLLCLERLNTVFVFMNRSLSPPRRVKVCPGQ